MSTTLTVDHSGHRQLVVLVDQMPPLSTQDCCSSTTPRWRGPGDDRDGRRCRCVTRVYGWNQIDGEWVTNW